MVQAFMSQSSMPESRLAPFIQEYMYRNGWTCLRPIQAEACRVIFESDDHLLVSAGTAAGKTEAAFIPVLTTLYDKPSEGIGALYIGPIKALINDQFERLTDLLEMADIPVQMWHGDVTQSQKMRVLKNPRGILQITPESLESLLINKAKDLGRVFGQLQFVIIDEVHAFIGSDRGDQVLCQLTRLAQLTGNEARRIGLSATLGDYALAERWLAAGTSRRVTTPKLEAMGARKIQLAVEHFYDSGVKVRAIGDYRDSAFNPYHLHLFQHTLHQKCLVFANGRTAAEDAVTAMRSIALAKGYADVYHVHHGSISADLRAVAETAMRAPDKPAVTAATVTFEMGIDLGQLDRVIQLESPSSVASFLQRLGRSGRRGGVSEMRLVFAEEKPTGEETMPEQVPWQLLQAIALIQLYIEEHWIEPPQSLQYPYSLLYHQTLSTLASCGEMTPAALAQQVLNLPPFKQVTQNDYRQLLRYWIELNHIEVTELNTLIVGLKGEKIVRNFKFYAIFPDNEEYIVSHNGKAIGSIMVSPGTGDRISLSGHVWEVIDVNDKTKAVKVRQTDQSANASSWRGTTGDIHTKVLQRMQRVLQEKQIYPYLQKGAKARLALAREYAQTHGIASETVVLLEDEYACIFPWMGSRGFRTLERYLRHHCRSALTIKGVRGRAPYFLVVNLGKCPVESLRSELQELGHRPLSPELFMAEDETPKVQKYDAYLPIDFLRKQFVVDGLAMDEVRTWALS